MGYALEKLGSVRAALGLPELAQLGVHGDLYAVNKFGEAPDLDTTGAPHTLWDYGAGEPDG